jgi:hypothetical protein
VTQAVAAAKGETPAHTRKAKRVPVVYSLQAQLRRKLSVAHKERTVIRFFENHPRLLRSSKHRRAARASLRHAERTFARTARQIDSLRRVLHARDVRRPASLSPKAAICDAFDGYCGEAVQVAWCESRLHTTAQNGEYRGLFQMGSYARRLYGHGPTAHEQAVAAHRYFISSGRDWSPWSCKPWRY